jgi:hypothetical protein
MAIASNGTLYLGDRLGNTDNLAAYAPPYTGAAVATMNPTAGVTSSLGQLLVAPNGDLWVSDNYNSFVLKYTAPISGSPSPTVTLTGMGSPSQLALDPSGNLFVGDDQSYQLDKYAPPITSGSGRSLVNNSPNVPMALLTNAAGNLYSSTWQAQGCFCASNLYLLPAGAPSVSAGITLNAVDASTNSIPRSLALGANGIYTVDLGANSIDEFNLGLTAKINTIMTGINQPYAIAIEP